MHEGGWNLDEINQKERLVLPGQTCIRTLDQMNKYSWFIQGWSPQKISKSFWNDGRVDLSFGNCNNEGEVAILVDGTEIKKSKAYGEETKVSLNVQDGTNLTIRADDRGIIRLFDLQIECGEFALPKFTLLIIQFAYRELSNCLIL